MIVPIAMSRRNWLLSGGAALVLVGGAWGLSLRYGRANDPTGLPPELSRENLKAQAANPDQIRTTFENTMQRTDLTEEQRREAMRRMRELWEARQNERMNEYFAAAADQKQAILDRQIDEMQKERQEAEARRAQWEKEHAQQQAQNGQHNNDRPRRDFASMTPQERKSRAESRNPDQTAKHMAYFAAVRARMAERGIQMPRGPMGGGGGPRH